MTDVQYCSLELPRLPKITSSVDRHPSIRPIYTSIASLTDAATIRVQLVLGDVVRADQHDLQCVDVLRQWRLLRRATNPRIFLADV